MEEASERAIRSLGNLAIWALALPLIRELHQCEIPTVVLKSLPQIEDLYGDLGTQVSIDVDLLVPAEHSLQAKQILNQLGWELENQVLFDILASAEGPAQASALRPWHFMKTVGKRMSIIDLHSDDMADWPAPPLNPGIWDRATTISQDGVTYRVLGAEDRLLFLCWHFLQHACAARIPWSKLRDIQLILERDSEIDWRYLNSRAQAAGLTIMLHLVCHLAESRSSTPLGAPWRTSVPSASPKRQARLERLMERWADSPYSRQRSFFWLLAHDRPLSMWPVWRQAFVPNRAAIASDHLGYWPTWTQYSLTLAQILIGRASGRLKSLRR